MKARQPAALALAVLTLAGSAAFGREAPGLRIFAAASLAEVVEELAKRYEGASVAASFGASSVLARQIRDGAPADVFLSASPDWIEFLGDAGVLGGEPIVLARTQLVAIAASGGSLEARPIDGPGALLAHLAPDAGIAIADEGVPAGDYARAALAHAGLLAALRARLVGQRDVRAVLHAVEQGAVTAGFVYATDAAVADVDRLFAFDSASHPPIAYQAAVLHGSQSPGEAARFLEYLRGERARGLLARAGFGLD